MFQRSSFQTSSETDTTYTNIDESIKNIINITVLCYYIAHKCHCQLRSMIHPLTPGWINGCQIFKSASLTPVRVVITDPCWAWRSQRMRAEQHHKMKPSPLHMWPSLYPLRCFTGRCALLPTSLYKTEKSSTIKYPHQFDCFCLPNTRFKVWNLWPKVNVYPSGGGYHCCCQPVIIKKTCPPHAGQPTPAAVV